MISDEIFSKVIFKLRMYRLLKSDRANLNPCPSLNMFEKSIEKIWNPINHSSEKIWSRSQTYVCIPSWAPSWDCIPSAAKTEVEQICWANIPPPFWRRKGCPEKSLKQYLFLSLSQNIWSFFLETERKEWQFSNKKFELIAFRKSRKKTPSQIYNFFQLFW